MIASNINWFKQINLDDNFKVEILYLLKQLVTKKFRPSAVSECDKKEGENKVEIKKWKGKTTKKEKIYLVKAFGTTGNSCINI